MPEKNEQWSIEHLISTYREAYARFGDSPAAVQWPKGRQDLRFNALTAHIKKDQFSLLDYGCGLGHLKTYLDARFSAYQYHGVDIVSDFIRDCTLKYRDATFELVRNHRDISREYDHVLISGVFNIVYEENVTMYRAIVRDTLEHLFECCRVALSVNFMTDRVDFKQEFAYHENIADLHKFLCDRLSPRLTLDQSYMPYEFTVTVFKDSKIVRPDNVYEPI